MLRPLIATLMSVAAVNSAAAQWRIKSLDLDVTLRPESHAMRIAGTAQVIASGSDRRRLVLAFGPDGATFDSVRITPATRHSFSGKRDSVLIQQPGVGTVRVQFFAHVDRDIGRNLIRPQGAMMSWGAVWYPVIAWSRDSTPALEFPGTTRITMPARWRTLSPGVLASSATADGLRTERWTLTKPMARSFVAAEFVATTTRVGSTIVSAYLLPRHASRIAEYAQALPRMVRTLSSFFGPYPFSTFGIAELPREVAPPGFAGRSEPGYFIAHTDALDGPGVNVPVFAHELTHMWFPNAVDSRPPGDDMMDEAIANYGVALYDEATLGLSAARRELLDGHPEFSMRGYFQQLRAGLDEPLMADYSPIIARAKGPLVYDMLRRRLGDSVFFGVWRSLAAGGGSASLADLRKLYVAQAPHDRALPTFLSQWMDRAGAPVIEWHREIRGESLMLIAEQRESPYVLDVPMVVHSKHGSRASVMHVAHAIDTLLLDDATSVDIDPNDELLLWKPRFGPPPNGPASWPAERWRAWMAEEIPWLMRSYSVAGVHLTIVSRRAVEWTAAVGTDIPDGAQRARALGDSLQVHRDSTPIRVVTSDGEDVSLTLGNSLTGDGVVVVARGGWGGRQLVAQLAQRVAVQYRWSMIPR